MTTLNVDKINNFKQALHQHPLLCGDVIQTIPDLRIFMEYHVYAVWDFMSLAKALQHNICPSSTLWTPSPAQRHIGRMINEIILGEETDIDGRGGYKSHFDLYLTAMKEIGADTTGIDDFIQLIQTTSTLSLNQCLLLLPRPSREFCNTTFEAIHSGKLHVIAATFAFGRETVIPGMFSRMIQHMDDVGLSAPTMKFYLERHVEVDGDSHGPASLEMIEFLCAGDPVKIQEAEEAAMNAIHYRIQLWNDVARIIDAVRDIRRNGVNLGTV